MRNKRNDLKAVALSCILVSGGALADTTADSLTRIEAETLVLKAREKQLEVQAQIIAKQGDILAKQVETDRLARQASAGDPIVRAIEGFSSALYATLELDNGSTLDVKVGDVLPNDMKVISIRLNEVIVETHKKRRVRLNIVSLASTSFNTGFSNAGVALPPLAPVLRPKGGSR